MPADSLDTIHVVFKTHLDVGFTDMPDAVARAYFEQFIPGAIATARALREAGGEERYLWTTGSWLIAEYLDAADAEGRGLLEEAIRAGEITWHALPFTAYTDLMDASLFRYGLSIARRLDERFGKRTIAAKMTDVPGNSRAVIHLLAEAGVQFFHIGVNEASPVPEVPQVFVWRDPEDGSEVVMAYHSGYGGVLRVPGLRHGLYIAFTNDNMGPHTPDDVRRIFGGLREQFPGARVIASTLDAFAAELLKVKAGLPVVTEEIGNSWIHGAGTDPTKVSAYRELVRLRAGWESEGAGLDDPRFERFSRKLAAVAEHTWGLDEKTHLHEYETFSPAKLAKALELPTFRKMEQSWQYERGYLTQALAELDDARRAEAEAALDALRPRRPDLGGFTRVADADQPIQSAHFELAFDPRSGAINHLVGREAGRGAGRGAGREAGGGRAWADAEHPLALFRYQSFAQADWDRFLDQYLIRRPEWALYDYSRPGVDGDGARAGWWLPRLNGLWQCRVEGERPGLRVAAELTMPEEAAQYGCPRSAALELFLPDSQPRIELALQWFDKPASRLPEALWLSFTPPGCDPRGWRMEKIDRWISPLAVVARGGRGLHAVDRGVRYDWEGEALAIDTLDAPLVSPGKPGILDYSDTIPDLSGGWHFNLFNNQWGTNHRAWFGEDARFRFVLE